MVSVIAQAETRSQAAAVAVPAATRAPRAAPPVSLFTPADNLVTITPQGTIEWEGQGIRLDDYLANLGALHRAAPGGESKLVIHANGTLFTQMAWSLDEARKAGIRHIMVESDAMPDPATRGNWF